MTQPRRDDDRIEQVNLSQRAAQWLRNQILSGALEPGSALVVRDLVGRLGVSHIPIREALRELEAESLVVSRPGQSVVVAGVDIGELHDLYRLRRLIEVDAIHRAFPSYTPEYLEETRKVYEGLLEETPLEEDGHWWSAHKRYHWRFLAPGLTPWATRLLQLVWQSSERYQRLYTLVFGSVDEANAEHDRILIVAAGGDVDAFVEAWLHHLDKTEDTIASGYVARHGNPEQRFEGTGTEA